MTRTVFWESSTHARLVGMICNTQTGFISHQFHIAYDNTFETVMGGYKDNEAVTNPIWDVLVTREDISEEFLSTLLKENNKPYHGYIIIGYLQKNKIHYKLEI